MNATGVLVTALGGVVGGGVVLLVVAIVGTAPRPTRPQRTRQAAKHSRQALFALGAALLALLITRWPVAAIGAGVLVMFGPVLFGGMRAERQAILRIEGLAAWIESLRDTIAGAVGLEQAIPATVHASSPAIRSELSVLVDRLRVRVPLAVALRRFADDLDDPSADLVVAALILNAKLRGPGLRQVLTSLGDAARAEVDMRQRVSAGRTSTRRSAQIVMGFSIAVILLLCILNRTYVSPYSTPTGQLVLVLVSALFAAGFAWMKKLSGIDLPSRFLAATPSRSGASDGSPEVER